MLAALVSQATNGTVSLSANGSLIYTPGVNFNGPDSFTYRAGDGQVLSNLATVTINVQPVNDPPVANNDNFYTPEDIALTVSAPGVLANDTDVDTPLDDWTAALVGSPAHGSLTLNTNGGFTYTPALNYSGPDSFTYRANDGQASSIPATVAITVTSCNSPPVAINDSYTTPEDLALTVAAPGVVANDSDECGDGGALTAVLVSAPARGIVLLNPIGSLIYTPAPNFNGSDSFTYHARAIDDVVTNDATVIITVQAVNDPPSFTKGSDQSLTDESGPQSIADWGTDPSAGPPDEAGQMLTFSVTSNSDPGLFAVQPEISPSGTLTFTPHPNAKGTTQVLVVLKDDGGTDNGGIDTSDPQTFTITVTKPRPWYNVERPLDASGDGNVTSLDALVVFNLLNSAGPGPVPQGGSTGSFYLDTNGDNFVSSIDALLVFNLVNAGGGAEGEAVSQQPQPDTLLQLPSGQQAPLPAATNEPSDLADILSLLSLDAGEQAARRRRGS